MELLISRELWVLVLLVFADLVSCLPEYFVEEHCSQTLALNLGSVEAVKLRLVKAKTYPNAARCAMRVQAPPGKRLQLKIEKIDIRGRQEAQCNGGDFIAFFDGPSEQSISLQGLPQRVCAKPSWSDLATSDRFLVILFASNGDIDVGQGMTVVITAFNDGQCSNEQFRCASTGRCIQGRLKCDGTSSCSDGSDEGLPKCLSVGAIAGIGIASVILLVAIIVIIAVCIVSYIRRKRARTIRRAIVSENSPNTFWYAAHHLETQRSQLDTANVDPVWDGDGYAAANNIHRKENNQNAARESVKHKVSIVKVVGPDGKELEKVPSGFWDIQFEEICAENEDMPSSEV